MCVCIDLRIRESLLKDSYVCMVSHVQESSKSGEDPRKNTEGNFEVLVATLSTKNPMEVPEIKPRLLRLEARY